jgi:hypothetical protein
VGLQIHLKGRSRAAYVGFRGRERSSIFIKRGRRAVEYIRPGASFRRVKPDKSVETAKILSVVLDGLRIPHVHYELALQSPSRAKALKVGPKTLSLASFADTYRSH